MNTMRVPRPLKERCLDCLLPPVCPGCGAEGYGFCEMCLSQIEPQCVQVSPTLTVYGAGIYHQSLRSAILQTKMLGYTYFSYALASAVWRALPMERLSSFPVVVVPIPPSRRRTRKRGFHCPSLIARELVRQIPNFVYRPDILRVTRELLPQKSLSRSERFDNVRDAYRANNVNDLYVLLIDDVLTTGATAYAASQALYQSGAMRVEMGVVGVRI